MHRSQVLADLLLPDNFLIIQGCGTSSTCYRLLCPKSKNLMNPDNEQPCMYLIGSLTAEHKASYSLVFSDIKQQQNIAGCSQHNWLLFILLTNHPACTTSMLVIKVHIF